MSYDVKERESEEERNCGKWTTRVANKGGCPINRGITLTFPRTLSQQAKDVIDAT